MNALAARRVEAFTGANAPDTFFRSLSEADEFCREHAEVHQLHARVADLHDTDRTIRQMIADCRLTGYRNGTRLIRVDLNEPTSP